MIFPVELGQNMVAMLLFIEVFIAIVCVHSMNTELIAVSGQYLWIVGKVWLIGNFAPRCDNFRLIIFGILAWCIDWTTAFFFLLIQGCILLKRRQNYCVHFAHFLLRRFSDHTIRAFVCLLWVGFLKPYLFKHALWIFSEALAEHETT